MTVSVLSPMSFTSYFDPYSGAPIQANLYFYHAGTLDLISVYADANLGITHAQPVVTGGSGRVPPIWIPKLANPTNQYRVRVFDQYSTLIEDVDYMHGATDETPGGGGEAPDDATRLLSTGDIVWSYSNSQPRLGFVLCNGLSVGSALSEGSQRRNDDTEALFKWLWGQDTDGTILIVAPDGRGASAASDWDANKHIATPDLMGRTVVGLDAMATTAKNRLNGVPVVSGAGQAKLGSVLGEALHTLTEAETAPHNHTITDPKHKHANALAAAHAHGASSSSGIESASHTHTVTITSAGAHDHSVPQGGGGTGIPAGTAVATAAIQSSQTTGSAGAHTHGTSVGTESANHTHAITTTVSSAGPHAVTMDDAATGISLAPTGGGGAHNTTQLSMALCAYMRL